MKRGTHLSALAGVGLVVIYTLAITLSDAFTKHLASSFAAPQILLICAGTILTLSLVVNAKMLVRERRFHAIATCAPRAMAVRAVMTVLAAVGFYYAFALLPFADVFLFIALVPIIAGLLSAPVLNEQVSPLCWAALGLGALGVFLLFPEGRADVTWGHLIAFGAVFTGTVAIVAARYIARLESKPLAQVFWPQAAIFVIMVAIAPFVWVPIGWQDVTLATLCGLTLFGARYALAVSLQVLPAYTATPLLNLQFVWMILIGMVIFNEVPETHTILGATVIVGTGLLLTWEQHIRPLQMSRNGAGQLLKPAHLRKARA